MHLSFHFQHLVEQGSFVVLLFLCFDFKFPLKRTDSIQRNTKWTTIVEGKLFSLWEFVLFTSENAWEFAIFIIVESVHDLSYFIIMLNQ